MLQDECATEVLAREEIRPAPKQLVRRVLSSLLHALSVRQSDVCLVRLFEGAIDFLRRYGARVFVSSVGDRMQVTSRNPFCPTTRSRLSCSLSDYHRLLVELNTSVYKQSGVVILSND